MAVVLVATEDILFVLPNEDANSALPDFLWVLYLSIKSSPTARGVFER